MLTAWQRFVSDAAVVEGPRLKIPWSEKTAPSVLEQAKTAGLNVTTTIELELIFVTEQGMIFDPRHEFYFRSLLAE